MQLLRMMASCITIVPHARLHMRPLQARQWNQSQGQLTNLVLADNRTHRSLQWWNPQNLSKGRPFFRPYSTDRTHSRCISNRLGGSSQRLHNTRPVDNKHKSLHINYLELLAVFLALKAFQTRLIGKTVLVRTHNMTAMYYVQKQGVTQDLFSGRTSPRSKQSNCRPPQQKETANS